MASTTACWPRSCTIKGWTCSRSYPFEPYAPPPGLPQELEPFEWLMVPSSLTASLPRLFPSHMKQQESFFEDENSHQESDEISNEPEVLPNTIQASDIAICAAVPQTIPRMKPGYGFSESPLTPISTTSCSRRPLRINPADHSVVMV